MELGLAQLCACGWWRACHTYVRAAYASKPSKNHSCTCTGSMCTGMHGSMAASTHRLALTLCMRSACALLPGAQSPEVMSSQPYDFKSDMWSLGCIVYEMMSLKHAFDAADMTSLVMKIMRGEHLPVPQQFSAELKDLVRQLLSKNPKLRPSCEQMLKMPFLKVCCGAGGVRVRVRGRRLPCACAGQVQPMEPHAEGGMHAWTIRVGRAAGGAVHGSRGET